MQILKVTDEAFRQYGKVIKDLDVSDIITAMSETPCPDDVVYETVRFMFQATPRWRRLRLIGFFPIICSAGCRFRSATATATTIY